MLWWFAGVLFHVHDAGIPHLTHFKKVAINNLMIWNHCHLSNLSYCHTIIRPRLFSFKVVKNRRKRLPLYGITFSFQLVVICQRTPIGDFDVLGLGLVIPNGKCKWTTFTMKKWKLLWKSSFFSSNTGLKSVSFSLGVLSKKTIFWFMNVRVTPHLFR